MKLQDFVQDKPVLETERLILRPLRKEDVSDLKEWLGDSSIYQYWGKRPGKSDLNPELLFQKPEKNRLYLPELQSRSDAECLREYCAARGTGWR